MTSSTWKRRLLMPLLIVAVAIAIAIWEGRRSIARDAVIKTFVETLVLEIAGGRDPQPLLDATSPLIRRELSEAIGSLGAPVAVVISRGDMADAGDFSPSATHVAALGVDGVDEIHLRLVHTRRDDRIAIIGFSRRQPTGGP